MDVKFLNEGEVVASGTKIGNCWWLDADVRSHEVCSQLQDIKGAHCLIAHERLDEEIPIKPQTLQTWHQRLGHLNKRDITRLQAMHKGIQIGNPLTKWITMHRLSSCKRPQENPSHTTNTPGETSYDNSR